MPNPEDLKAFLAVAETASVTRAAERLGLTQSGVSRKIAGLEVKLGFRLFDRSRGRVALNRRGRAFAPHARQVVDAVGNLPRIARTIGKGAYDRVRVAATSSIMHGLLPPALAQYCNERPDLPPSTAMRSLNEVLNLEASDTFDIVIAPLPMRPLAFELAAEYPFKLALAVPRSLLPPDEELVDGVWPSLERLAELPFISLDPFASYQESTESVLAGLGLKVSYMAETTSVVTAALMTRAGVGCAFLDPFIAAAFTGPEVVIGRTVPPMPHAYGAHIPRGADISPETKRLLNAIEQIVETEQDG
jgi:DNA-binding transcriptional LysR family regulator